MIMPNLFNFFLAGGWGLSHQETRNKKIYRDRFRQNANQGLRTSSSPKGAAPRSLDCVKCQESQGAGVEERAQGRGGGGASSCP